MQAPWMRLHHLKRLEQWHSWRAKEGLRPASRALRHGGARAEAALWKQVMAALYPDDFQHPAAAADEASNASRSLAAPKQ